VSDFSKRCSDVLLEVGKVVDEGRNSSNRTILMGIDFERALDVAMIAAYQERTEIIREGLKTLAVLVSRK